MTDRPSTSTHAVAPDRLDDYQREAVALRRARAALRFTAYTPDSHVQADDRQRAMQAARALHHLTEAAAR